MKRTGSLIMFLLLFQTLNAQESNPAKEVSINGMDVTWKFEKRQINITMAAPTQGWLAIGFNTTTSLKNTYLIMGRITNGQVEIVEHFTNAPGDYSPIVELGGEGVVRNFSGKQLAGKTKVSFSLPVGINSKFQKDLTVGLEYHLLLAYSLETDFQHHSIMRTSTKIKL